MFMNYDITIWFLSEMNANANTQMNEYEARELFDRDAQIEREYARQLHGMMLLTYITFD